MQPTASWTDSELQHAAQRCANVYAQIANEMFFGCNITIPVLVDYRLCETAPKTAGMAIGLDNIAINMIIYSDNPEEILNQVVQHEVAHLVIHQVLKDVQGIHGHGPEWRHVMKRLGKSPDRYHKMDVTKAKEWHKEFKKDKKKDETGTVSNECVQGA